MLPWRAASPPTPPKPAHQLLKRPAELSARWRPRRSVRRPTSSGIDLNAPLTVVDLSRIDRNSVAMPIPMAVLGVWFEHVWLRPDGVKRILLVEGAWHIINTPAPP